MKKQLLLFIATFVSFLNAMASSNAGINASRDVQIQKLDQQSIGHLRPRAPERILFRAYLDTDLALLFISSVADLNEVSVRIENCSTGEIEFYSFDSSEMAVFPISCTSGIWRVTLTLENEVMYFGEFEL